MTIDINWLSQQFPKIQLLAPLPPGGQKWVFRCIDPDYGPCVLKLIKPGAVGRLDREIEAVFRLSSENVPRVYKIGEVDSQTGKLIWLLEQYVEGVLLSDKLRRNGSLNQAELVRLAIGLITAAMGAESVQVVHRDIKPGNIIIDSNMNPWLLDFGIARILDMESRTRTDAAFGPHTPGYGAPEQFKNRKNEIDGRSDLFAIGIVLYESATGSNPFLTGVRDVAEILRRVERMPLPPFRLSWDPNDLISNFVLALTQKYPYQRPRSCADASRWLQAIVTNYGGL